MSAKFVAVILFSVLLWGCSKQEQFPEPVSEKIPEGQFTVNQSFYLAKPVQVDSLQEIISDDLPGELIQMKALYEKKDAGFNLNEMEEFWNDVKTLQGIFSFTGIKNWIDATGFLLEITGKEIYAAELERIQYIPDYVLGNHESNELKALLEPYIFTRNTDYFHINLFANATVQFEHSMIGQIKITEETDFPASGDISLKVNTVEKRFMEIFVRIPEWAAGATVTVMNVKYIAPPGEYCQIARSWENNDLVEIHFPVEKMPGYFLNQ